MAKKPWIDERFSEACWRRARPCQHPAAALGDHAEWERDGSCADRRAGIATVRPWFFGNGSLPGRWKPAKTGTGANWDLSAQLQGLSSLKSHLTVLSGLTNKLVVGGREHQTGSAGATTGAPLNGNAVTAASINQVVAKLISTGAPFHSIEVGVTPATPNGGGTRWPRFRTRERTRS